MAGGNVKASISEIMDGGSGLYGWSGGVSLFRRGSRWTIRIDQYENGNGYFAIRNEIGMEVVCDERDTARHVAEMLNYADGEFNCPNCDALQDQVNALQDQISALNEQVADDQRWMDEQGGGP